MWHNHYWGMHFFWWIFWIFMIVIFISSSFSSGREDTQTKNGAPSALDVLQKKYAAGELTTEEYRERKKVLEEE